MAKQKTLQEKLESAQATVDEIRERLLKKKKEGFAIIAEYNKQVEAIADELKKAEAKLEIRKEDLEDSK